jgi:hypothetical protein
VVQVLASSLFGGKALAYNTKALPDSLAVTGAQLLVPDLECALLHLLKERNIKLALLDALGEEGKGREVGGEVHL